MCLAANSCALSCGKAKSLMPLADRTVGPCRHNYRVRTGLMPLNKLPADRVHSRNFQACSAIPKGQI